MSCVRPETERKTRHKGKTGLSLSAGRSRLPSTRANMFVPENVTLAAHSLDPQDRGVVKAWVESGGDANCHFDPANHGGTLNVHRLLTQVEDGGETLLFLVVYGDKISSPGGPFSKSDEERDCRDRLELIRYLLSRGADPNLGAADGSTSLHILCDDSRRAFRLAVANLLLDAGVNIDAPSGYLDGQTPLSRLLSGCDMDWLTLFLRRGASLDFPAVTEVNRHGILTNTAEAYMQSGLIYLKSPECTYNKIYIPRSIVIAEKKLRLFTAVRAAGSWKGYVRSPHIKLVVSAR